MLKTTHIENTHWQTKAIILKKVKEAIDEAEYLYQKMEETLKVPMEFRSNLNAFLSRSRAVTWVLKKQLNDNPSFASWYSAQEEIMKNDELMAFFIVARNISEKEYPIRPNSSGYIRHITVNTDNKRGFAITGEGEPIWVSERKQTKARRKEPTQKNLITNCQFYITLIIPNRLNCTKIFKLSTFADFT